MLYSFDEKNWDNIPKELASLRRWIIWKYVDKKYFDGIYRTTKVPVSPVTHSNFSRTEEECLDLENTKRVYRAYKHDDIWAGIGFSSHGNENIVVLDFDDCLENFKIKSKSLESFIYNLNSYTEISPSGKGVRIFVKYSTPDKIFYSFQVISNRGTDLCTNFNSKGIEIWNKNKFATVTGNLYDNHLDRINSNDLILEDFLSKSKETLENFLESIKNRPKRNSKRKEKLQDCSALLEEDNFWEGEEEQYINYNEDDYEDPFEYINPKSLQDGTYQDNTPLN